MIDTASGAGIGRPYPKPGGEYQVEESVSLDTKLNPRAT